ncbi:MAG: M56 family metallopeptidase [Candidatus Kerfeldbacteria bacterium]|nr:M56 family metallopeptidase [Candidatus Kerfeldbacteria bacterium]
MNRETRQYRDVRLALLGFTVVVFVGLAVGAWRLWPAVQQNLQTSRVGCGCTQFILPANPWLGGLGLAVIGVALVAFGRFGWAIVHHLRRTRIQAEQFQTAGCRIVHHERLNLTYAIVSRDDVFAVTVGCWRPMVYVSAGLVRQLRGLEVESVLRHEQAHVRARDPLMMTIVAAIHSTFGWLPMVSTWVKAGYTLRELSADAAATDDYQQPRGLAGAFLKMSEPLWPATTSAFSPNTDRLNKLLDANWHPPVRLWRWTHLLTVAVALTALFGIASASRAQVTPSDPNVRRLCQETKIMCHLEQANGSANVLCFNGQCLNINRPWTPAYEISFRP